MFRGHPVGNQDLEVDDTALVEFIQHMIKKINTKQKHADGQAADVCVIFLWAYLQF